MLLRRCGLAASRVRPGCAGSVAATKARRWISPSLRSAEHSAVVNERMHMIGRDEHVVDVSISKTTQEILDSAPLPDITPKKLFSGSDIVENLELTSAFMTKVVRRAAGGPKLSDKWAADFLLSLYHALKRHDIAVSPAKVSIQVLKTFMDSDLFEVGTNALNTLISTTYHERVDVRTLYDIYGRFKEKSIRPNHYTLAYMFNVSIRAHRNKNAENFYNACEKLLKRKDFSFSAKQEVINTLCVGFHDSQNSEYPKRLIRLLSEMVYEDNQMVAQQVPKRMEERTSAHLYLSREVAQNFFWGARSRCGELFELMEKWYNFLDNRDNLSFRIRIYFTKTLVQSGKMLRAYEMWDEMALKVEDKKHLPGNDEKLLLKAVCINILEQSARDRTPALIDKSRKLMDTMIKLKIIPDNDRKDVYALQIKLHVHSNEFETAFELYNKIKAECKGSCDLVKAMCSGPHASKNLPILTKVFYDFKSMADAAKEAGSAIHYEIEGATTAYIGLLADCGELGMVMDTLQKIDSKPSLDTFHKVLSACARDKGASSYGTFYKWSEGGQDALPLYFSHLKNSRTTQDNCVVAQGIFDKLKEYKHTPTVQTYNLLIAVYSAAKNYDEVSRLYDLMKSDKKLGLDQTSFYYAAKVWADKGAVDRVETVFQELMDASKDTNNKSFSLTPEFCAMAIRALSNSGMKLETMAYIRKFNAGDEEMDWMDQEEEAKLHQTKQPRAVEVDTGFKFLDAMKDIGVSPTINVYTALLGLCTRAGDHQRAENVYHMIQEDDADKVMDRSDIITNLMKMHYTRDAMDDAMALLLEVSQHERATLDTTAYHNCIATCASKGSVVNASHVLSLMFEDQNVRVTDTAISLAVLACAYFTPEDLDVEIDRISKAYDVLTEYRELHKLHRDRVPVVNSQEVFHQLLHVCATCKNPDEARRVIDEMKHLNLSVNKMTLAYLARSYSDTSDFADFWKLMSKFSLEPDTAIVFALLMCCQVNDDANAALDIVVRYPHLCDEKLQLYYYRIFETARLPEDQKATHEMRFKDAFKKNFATIERLVEDRKKEKALESATIEQDLLKVVTDKDTTKKESNELDFEDEGDDEDDTDVAGLSF